MEPAKDLLNKGKERAKAYHDSVHEACHTKLQQKMVMSSINTPTPADVLRYRYHHGVSLGSCFVLEKWITPSMFAQGADSSELAAVTASVSTIGEADTRHKWESHWTGMVSDTDFDWLVNVAHCTSIRLPVGYWDVGAVKGTPFEPVSSVYTTAMSSIKAFVARAWSRGIGTLIDLHGLPGGANKGDHSGTNSGKAELWRNKKYLDLAVHCIYLLVQDISRMEGIIGLQVCNEADWEAPGIFDFYDRALKVTAQIDPTMPVYISDAWNLESAIKYIQGKNTVPSDHGSPVVIDTHCYWTFSAVDTAKSPQQIISEVPKKLAELEGRDGNVVDHGAAQVVVGEYSCCQAESTWAQVSPNDRPHLVVQFGQTQSKRWQQRTGGSFFWTYKMDWMDGGEWGFVEQTKNGSVTPPSNLVLPTSDVLGRGGVARSKRTAKRTAAVDEHKAYWDHAAPGSKFEHWRYETGWDIGYSDAMVFWNMRASGKLGKTCGVGGDKIGFVDLWVKKRIRESGMTGPFLWEFEHGLRRGINDFYDAAGI